MKGTPLLSNEKFCQGFFCGAYLFLGISSLASKILLPAMVALSEGSLWMTYVTVDFWWAAYFYIGWKMQYPSKSAWIFCILACSADFLISVFRLLEFSRNPLWTVWKASMLFNNAFSMGLAFLLFFYLFSHSTRKEFGLDPTV